MLRLSIGVLLFTLSHSAFAGWCDLSALSGAQLSQKYTKLFEAGYGAGGIPVLKANSILRRGSSVNFRGITNLGVIEVESTHGPAILKFFPPEMTLEKNQVSLSLQKYLGDLGVAPEVFGVLKPEEVAALTGRSDVGPALLMKKGPGSLVKRLMPKSIKNYGPNQMTHEAAHRAAESIRIFEGLLNSLSVYGEDVQFLMTDDGQVSMFDFDFYAWKSPQGRVHAVDPVRSGWLERRETMAPNDFSFLADFIEKLSQ